MVFNNLNQLFKAMLNKSVRVEFVETNTLQIINLHMASTGSAQIEGLVQHCLKEETMVDPNYIGVSKGG